MTEANENKRVNDYHFIHQNDYQEGETHIILDSGEKVSYTVSKDWTAEQIAESLERAAKQLRDL